jgi:hypothetical protein
MTFREEKKMRQKAFNKIMDTIAIIAGLYMLVVVLDGILKSL